MKTKWKRRAIETISVAWGPDWGDDGLVEQVAIDLETAWNEGRAFAVERHLKDIYLEFDARNKVRKFEELMHKFIFDDSVPAGVTDKVWAILRPPDHKAGQPAESEQVS